MEAIGIDINFRGVAGTRSINIAEEEHFVYGFNFYMLFWLFVLGSVAGFIIETIWCFVKYGQLQCRSSLLFGPFAVVYGIGALVLYVSLNKINKEKKLHIFGMGMIAGSVVEYVCSLVQERVFGSVSWDYSGAPLNIGGRVCLLYSVFWGLLALLWVYALYPGFENVMLKIPSSSGKIMAWILLIFLIFDICVSAIAVSRWSMRMQGMTDVNTIGTIVDTLFPNTRMEYIYSSMTHLVNS